MHPDSLGFWKKCSMEDVQSGRSIAWGAPTVKINPVRIRAQFLLRWSSRVVVLSMRYFARIGTQPQGRGVDIWSHSDMGRGLKKCTGWICERRFLLELGGLGSHGFCDLSIFLIEVNWWLNLTLTEDSVNDKRTVGPPKILFCPTVEEIRSKKQGNVEHSKFERRLGFWII